MTSDELLRLKDLAERNFGDSQIELAHKLALGDGVIQDLAKARYWYERASAEGYAGATYHLGLMHLLGEGGEKRPDVALKLFDEAAQQGSDDANFILGDAYANGALGLEEDPIKAAQYYLEACSCGGAFRAIPSLGKLIIAKKIDSETLAGLMCGFGQDT